MPGTCHELIHGTPPRLCAETPAALLFGYSVYTTFRWPILSRWLTAHLTRLAHDAQTLGMDWRFDPAEITERLTTCFQTDAPVMRLTVIPAIRHYADFYDTSSLRCRVFLSCRPSSPASGDVKLHAVPCRRAMPLIKHGGMADIIVLRRKARQQGCDDILLLDAQGAVCEASTANVFFIRDGRLLTPEPRRDGCLPGITRLQVLEAAKTLGVPVSSDAPIHLDALSATDGAFLTNAVQGLIRVASVDETRLPWPAEAEELFNALQAAHRDATT